MALTVAGAVGLIGGSSAGRSAVARMANRVRWGLPRLIGYPPNREEIDADLRLGATRGSSGRPGSIAVTSRARSAARVAADPRGGGAGAARRDPAVGQHRRDRGALVEGLRGQRLRPSVPDAAEFEVILDEQPLLTRRAVGFFFLPDTPEVRSAMAEAEVDILAESFQATNSWGCRGPEPDPVATVRGLVLGDSFMQGIFVADDDTPPVCLARATGEAWGVPVTILNTGHIGYSPEQYYYTLLEYFDRFHPQFVVLSVCPNDFGDTDGGPGRRRRLRRGEVLDQRDPGVLPAEVGPCLLVPVPLESQVDGVDNAGALPRAGLRPLRIDLGRSTSTPPRPSPTSTSGWSARPRRPASRPATSPLFNGHLGTATSRPGSALWAREVGRRVALLDPTREPAAPGRK